MSSEKEKALEKMKQAGLKWQSTVAAFRAGTPLPALTIDRAELAQLWSDLAFAGFDQAMVYAKTLEKTKGSAKDMVKLISACILLGNNYVARSKKVTKKETGEAIRTFLSGLDVVAKKSAADTLTPARISSTFPLITLFVRQEMEKSGTLPGPGLETSTPAVLCDLGLAPLSETNKSIVDFLEKMAIQLNNARKASNKDDKTTDDDAKKRMHQFRMIQVNAYKTSPFKSEMKVGEMSLEAALTMYGFQ